MKNLASLLPPLLLPPPPPLLLATNLIRTFARQKFTSVNLAALSLLIKQINVPVLSYTTLIIRIHYPIPDDRYPQSRNFPSYVTITRFHESKHVVYYE